MKHLVGSIKEYGLLEGLSIYLRLKNFQLDHIQVSNLNKPVHFRPGSTDICVFKQMFLGGDLGVSVLDSFYPATIMDLGANIGMASLYLINKFPNARIIAVEPDEDNARMFELNLKGHPNVELILGAVRGDHKNVKIVDSGRGASGYEIEEDELGKPAVTISDIREKNNWEYIDVLKMDIEGSEKSVFEGNFDSWLPKTKILFVELHERKIPGCEDALNEAISNYNFKRAKTGEYELLINQNLI